MPRDVRSDDEARRDYGEGQMLRLRCRHVDWDLLDANGCRFALRGGKATLGLFAEYRIAR
jgi:hypothetical protein